MITLIDTDKVSQDSQNLLHELRLLCRVGACLLWLLLVCLAFCFCCLAFCCCSTCLLCCCCWLCFFAATLPFTRTCTWWVGFLHCLFHALPLQPWIGLFTHSLQLIPSHLCIPIRDAIPQPPGRLWAPVVTIPLNIIAPPRHPSFPIIPLVAGRFGLLSLCPNSLV